MPDETRRERLERLQRAVARILPEARVSTCGGFAGFGTPELGGRRVTPVYSPEGRSYFGNLVRCQSAWVCPSCGSAKCNARRVGVGGAIDKFQERNGSGFFVTRTTSHQRTDTPKKMIGVVQDVLKSTMAGKYWHNLKTKSGVEGIITAREVTYGSAHGWHVHSHSILGLHESAGRTNAMNVLDYLIDKWQSGVKAYGFRADEQFQDVQSLRDGVGAGEYVTKYGAEWEITHGHMKDARHESMTPWALADAYDRTGNTMYRDLFREFAEAFYRARQLTGAGIWRGLPSKVDRQKSPALAFIESDALQEIIRQGGKEKLRQAFDASGIAGLMAVMQNYGFSGVWPGAISPRVVVPSNKPGRKKEN